MESFSEFIDVSWLIDLPLVGCPFSWSSGRFPPTLSCLDRFLVSSEWEEKFSDVVQATLACPLSDHVPLMLDGGGLRSRRSPFRFENMWLRAKGFLERVWNKEAFGNLVWRKNRVFSEIADIDRMEGQGILSDSLTLRRVECQTEFAVMEEISWRRGNHIGRIRVDEALFCKEEEICKGIADYYSLLFTESDGWRPVLAGLHFDSISGEDCSVLEELFSEEEVLSAVKSCNGDKAPGPDGFSMRFLSEC
ncbi:uncharacterized protein LOC132314538 [Cornus florida]|uniref:uncharacterized protein LOC132314538 n=1 Tax=Cornus florida TaxID=4283 RepID=UPI0028A22FB8|nr:uncharacterized protein LOC132314538 [Cornus florida]